MVQYVIRELEFSNSFSISASSFKLFYCLQEMYYPNRTLHHCAKARRETLN
jgi:hypothetical protein